MKSTEFAFDYVYLLYYKCHKINSNRSRSYIDSPDWIKSKKAKVNPINKKDSKCFQYVEAVELSYKEIKKRSTKITKLKPFIHFPSEKHDQKKIKENNVTIALNVLYDKKEKICPVYVSKQNSNREKQVILLLVSNREIREGRSEGRWHYLAIKKL